MSNSLHIGQILIDQGVLNEQQVFQALQAQRHSGVPFGVLAERMFDVTLASIERAWVEQYQQMTGTIDLSGQEIDEQALTLISRRQAWQFEMIPLGFEPDGELVIAASSRRLPRSVTFGVNQLGPVVYFRVAETNQLREFLQRYYPMPEISQHMIDRARSLAWARSA